MNYIKQYNDKIESSEILACQKIKKVYKHLVFTMSDKNSIWEYDDEKAMHAINFIERYCKHSKGAYGGKPLILELWQKAMIAALFGFVHVIDRTRRFRELVFIVGRKNGKSMIGSAIALYMLMADGESGPEVASVSTKRDQSKIIWLEAKRMVKKSPALSKRAKCLVGEIVTDFNDGSFKPLSSESSTLDGLNLNACLADELHAWTDKNLYDVTYDSMTAREEPLYIICSTSGTVRDGIFDIKLDECEQILNGYFDGDGYKDERILPIIYELDSREEFKDPVNFIKANPGIGTIKSFDQLQAKVKKALANPLLVRNLLTKDFNVKSTGSESFLNWEQLNNEATFDIAELKPRYCIAGIDLSATTDLTACVIIFRMPNDEILYVKSMFWLPADVLEQRVKEDHVPYDVWIERGLMRVSAGNKVDYKDVTKWLLEVQNEMDCYIFKIGYDNWSSKYLIDELQANFGRESTEPVIQGAKTFSNPLKRFAADLEAKKINYDNHPVMKMCMVNAAVAIDRNDNYALCKTSNAKKRIDGVAALMDAIIAYENNYENYMGLI